MKDDSKRIYGWFIGNTVLILTVFFFTNALLAQDDPMVAKLNATKALMLKMGPDPGYQNSIHKSSLEYENSLSTHCKNVDLEFDSPKVTLLILWPVEMNDKGVPTSGSWKETVPGTACGEKRMYNVQVDFTGKGPQFIPTYPGTAQGNPELQHDTLNNIEMAKVMVPGVKKSCKVEVMNTELVGPQSTVLDNGQMSPWKEEWDVRMCDKLFIVPVKYTSDGKGTFVNVGISEIHAH
jgi:hypothetical protein